MIIPVYNAEKYLDECISSVLGQTTQNLEVILIDDGSDDSSPGICDTWAKSDSRVIVFHRINSGPSASRNFGLAHSSGDYIFFLDADDTLPENALTELMQAFRKSRMPITVGNLIQFFPNGETKILESHPPEGDIPAEAFLRQMISYGLQRSWGKLYQRACLQDQDGRWICFREDLCQSEDVEWLTRVLVKVPGVAYTNKVIYRYRRGERGSATFELYQSYDRQKICSALEAYEAAIITMQKAGFDPNPSFLFRKNYFICIALEMIQNDKKTEYNNKADIARFRTQYWKNARRLLFLLQNWKDWKEYARYIVRYCRLRVK